MAKSIQAQVGGIWFAIIGAPLGAYFLLAFWIAPLLGIPTITNISQVLNFSGANVESILIFLALWFGIALGYIGGTGYRRGKK